MVVVVASTSKHQTAAAVSNYMAEHATDHYLSLCAVHNEQNCTSTSSISWADHGHIATDLSCLACQLQLITTYLAV